MSVTAGCGVKNSLLAVRLIISLNSQPDTLSQAPYCEFDIFELLAVVTRHKSYELNVIIDNLLRSTSSYDFGSVIKSSILPIQSFWIQKTCFEGNQS